MSSDEQIFGSISALPGTRVRLLDRAARNLVHRTLAALDRGMLQLVEPERAFAFGDHSSGPTAMIRVHDPAFYRAVALGGSIGAAEAYMAGHWSSDDLPAVIRLMVRNQEALNRMEGGLAFMAGIGQRLRHWLRDNSRAGSRRNIAAHYDLSNEFYALFLDRTMAYSCGLFQEPTSTMEEASIAKFDRICCKLRLTADMRLLEIGTGWGGFALHAARTYGCRVTTTTISRQQYEYATALIAREGLGERITLRHDDYRDLSGQFDRLVSIEMIEAVGHRHLPTFFATCSRLLKPDGMGLIQAITVPDRVYERYRRNPDFINRYIFPGGCCPSLAALTQASAGASDLAITHVEDLAPHYVRTLQAWRRVFLERLDQVRALGFNDRFIRMWEYYLCYCEGGFAEQFTGLLQLVFTRPGCRTPVGDPGQEVLSCET